MSNQRFGLTLVITVGCVLAWACASLLDGGHATATTLLTPTLSPTGTPIMPSAVVATPTAQPQQEAIRPVGGLGGESFTIALSGTLALVGEGYRLVAYDVSNAAQPIKKGALVLPGTPKVIRIYGNYAILGHEKGIHIVDIGDAANIHTRTVIENDTITDIQIAGSIAYVSANTSLFSIDLIDIEHPIFGGSIYGSFGIFVIAPNGILYTALYDEIVTVDFANRSQPVIRTRQVLNQVVRSLLLKDSYLWISTYEKVFLFATQDSDKLRYISAYSNKPGAYGALGVDGSLAYTIRWPNLEPATSFLEVIDASSPLSLTFQADIELPGTVNDLALNNDYIYTVGTGGLTIVTRNTNPPVINGQLVGSRYVNQILNDGTRVFTLGRDALSIYPAETTNAPAMLGQYVSPFFLYDGVVVDNIAYLAAGGNGGLLVVDVSAGHTPTLIGRLITPGSAIKLDVANGFAYIADGATGLLVVDVRVPSQPKIAGQLTGLSVSDVLVAGTTVYAIEYYGGLRVIDASDPAQPTLVQMQEAIGATSLYQVANGMLYSFDATRGYSFSNYIDVIDVRDSLTPKPYARINSTSYVQNMVVQGTRAFILTFNGIEIVDVSKPERPAPLTRVRFDLGYSYYGYGNGLAVADNAIYVGVGPRGVLIFSFDPSVLHPSSSLLPVVIQEEQPPFPTYETVTPTFWDIAFTAPPTSTTASPEATVTPCTLGCTATPTPSAASADLSINVENDQPAVGDNLLTYGDIVNASNNGIARVQVVVMYSFEGSSGQWCQATTDSDGYWECNGTVTNAMQDKQVSLTAQATINGTALSRGVIIVPHS